MQGLNKFGSHGGHTQITSSESLGVFSGQPGPKRKTTKYDDKESILCWDICCPAMPPLLSVTVIRLLARRTTKTWSASLTGGNLFHVSVMDESGICCLRPQLCCMFVLVLQTVQHEPDLPSKSLCQTASRGE